MRLVIALQYMIERVYSLIHGYDHVTLFHTFLIAKARDIAVVYVRCILFPEHILNGIGKSFAAKWSTGGPAPLITRLV